ncbi:hypothetical protein GALL_289690 [mine drainage metagenome]|uniref:Type II secretion system protein G n=1 Tax=mine drainage metagenome TaxID=410659 RepID=A0A1J5RAK3_9ZZZZ
MPAQKGFTLIEMAVVLAIIGLILSSGLMMIGPVMEKNRITQTSQNMDQVESALQLFAIRNQRLPCPADGSLTAGNALYGVEQPSGGTATACTVAAANAVIPWVTLGLAENLSLDGWNRRFSYMAANSQTGGTAADSLVYTGCLYRNVSSGSRPTLCDPDGLTPSYPYGNYLKVENTAGTEITTANPGGTPTTSTVSSYGGRAAYVLISHGHNGYYGWQQNGVQIAAGAVHTYELDNSAYTVANTFVQGPENDSNTANHFDDIVRWRTPAYLIQTCGSGACGNP